MLNGHETMPARGLYKLVLIGGVRDTRQQFSTIFSPLDDGLGGLGNVLAREHFRRRSLRAPLEEQKPTIKTRN